MKFKIVSHEPCWVEFYNCVEANSLAEAKARLEREGWDCVDKMGSAHDIGDSVEDMMDDRYMELLDAEGDVFFKSYDYEGGGS